MNQEQFKGQWNQFKGELKKRWGQITDDDLMEAQGDFEKFKGLIQKRYGDKKDEVTKWTEDWYSKHPRGGGTTRQ